MTGILLKPYFEYETINLDDENWFKEMKQKAITTKHDAPCDLAELVQINLHGQVFDMYINEEGKLIGEPFNEFGTALYNNPYDCIVGKAFLLAPCRDDSTGLTEKQVHDITKALMTIKRICHA